MNMMLVGGENMLASFFCFSAMTGSDDLPPLPVLKAFLDAASTAFFVPFFHKNQQENKKQEKINIPAYTRYHVSYHLLINKRRRNKKIYIFI